jgi:hypothetical protein
MIQHRVRTSATADGWTAACTCGWRTVRRTREQRDQDTGAHQLGNAVAQSEEATASDARPHRHTRRRRLPSWRIGDRVNMPRGLRKVEGQ